mmetsp:Transcript_36228/g.84724  ORF Transcript_36228/g.84724 Transcript_36228/m.84724 type:complete len:224 (+) Transcript_36228:353-1024(+)
MEHDHHISKVYTKQVMFRNDTPKSDTRNQTKQKATSERRYRRTSMRIFIRSHTSFVDRRISSSDTVRMSSAKSRMMGHVLGPSVVFRPSATLFRRLEGSCPSIWPEAKDLAASSICSGSARTIFTEFPSNPRSDMQFPAARPPPPTGIITTSNGGVTFSRFISFTCSTNSRHTVPCPAITSGSSLGCTNNTSSSPRRRISSIISSHFTSRAIGSFSHNTTSAQ